MSLMVGNTLPAADFRLEIAARTMPGTGVQPAFLTPDLPAPVQEADQGRSRAQRDVVHRASAATHPVGFFNRPFGLPFGGHLQPRASTVCPDTLPPRGAVSASPKEQRRPHWV
jgi:hypothetical protein